MVDKTPISEFHQRNAKLTEFAGFELPLWYKGITAECLRVRESVGAFDVSHMGRVVVSGADSELFLNHITTNNVAALTDGKGQYSLVCNEKGGVKDDVVVLRFEAQFFLVIFNASNREKDLAWFNEKAGDFNVRIENVSDNVAMFAVQGPKAWATLQKVCSDDISSIPRFGCKRTKIAEMGGAVSRTGYTGEDGFEVFVWDTSVQDSTRATKVWDSLLKSGGEHGIQPCGLGARDVLRLEAGMCLYGNDIDENTTPLEARLGFVTKLEKGDFIGREPIVKQKLEGVRRVRVGLTIIGRGIARPGNDVLKDDRNIGRVTSGTFSPTVKRGIAMAYVPLEYSEKSEILMIKTRNRTLEAEVVDMPFFDKAVYGWQRKAFLIPQ